MELLVYPAIYKLWRQRTMKHLHTDDGETTPPPTPAFVRAVSVTGAAVAGVALTAWLVVPHLLTNRHRCS